MPAAKMVADSTQSDSALERKKRRRDDKDYHKKNKKDGNRSRRSHSPHRNSSSSRRSAGSHSEKSSQKEEDSDNSDMDLSKPLKPIGSYIKNRSEMLDQMFRCIKGSTLKSAIPEELKCMSYQELKQHCLAQLEVMSKKRILRILAGDDPANISSSGTEESGDDQANKHTDSTQILGREPESDHFS